MTALGGSWRVPLSDVRVDDELRAAADEAVSSGWWSMGPRVGEFEKAFASLCRTKHAFAVSNGTAALHLALLASGCGPGDEIVLPSLNFVAAANTILATGATPVFCDIRGGNDLNLDPADVEAALSPASKAVLVLHYGGTPCDMPAVLELAAEHGLLVIEDAAHAPGARVAGKPCGSLGIAGCFSFFSNKNLPVGEGGMLVTDDDAVAERVRLLRSHGMTTLTWDRHRGHASSYDVLEAGFNYRLDEVRAAIGLVQLARLKEANAARRRLVERYRERLGGREGCVLAFGDDTPQSTSAHHLAVAVLPQGVDRDRVRADLQAEGIQTSVHYPPIHRFTLYVDRERERPLPRTDEIADRIVTLPLYPHLADHLADLVAESLVAAVRAQAV